MMARTLMACLVALLMTPAAGNAQQGGSPLLDAVKGHYDIVKRYLARSAEKVPEDVWSFKPTPEVRSFGQIIGHIADAQYMFCSAATGAKPPRADVEKTVTGKAALTQALAESTAYCDKQLASLDEQKAMEPVKFFGGMQPRAMVLSFNVAHDFEHYGNLVTYMRLKNIVPPSSEGAR